jgi:hypothetical protein
MQSISNISLKEINDLGKTTGIEMVNFQVHEFTGDKRGKLQTTLSDYCQGILFV